MMTITYSLTLDDFIVFCQYCARTSPIARRNYWITYTTIPLVVLVITAVALRFEIHSAWIAPLLFVFFWLIIYPFSYRQAITSNVKKYHQRDPNNGIVGEHCLEVQETVLIERTHLNEMKSSWQSVKRVEQDENYIYIFFNDYTGHVVPKRSFSTSDNIQTFFDTVSRYRNRAAT